MSGALLLHTASRSRTPAEAAIGDPERIAEIAAFAWELGGGSICDVLSFPASGMVPSWAVEDAATQVLCVSANLSAEEIYEIGKTTGKAILNQCPLWLLCRETFGYDYTHVYWQGLVEGLIGGSSEDVESLWTQVENLISNASSLVSVLCASPRTLSSPPPGDISETRSGDNIREVDSLLPRLRRLYEKTSHDHNGPVVSARSQLLFSQLPAAGGGVAALLKILGIKPRAVAAVIANTQRVQNALSECSLVISMVDELNTWQVSSWLHQDIIEAANHRAIPCILVAKNSSLNRMEMADLGLEARYEVRSSMEPDVVKVFSRLARTWGRV